ALLGREDRRDLLDLPQHVGGGSVQDLGALRGRQLAPGLLGSGRGLGRPVDVLDAAVGDPVDHLSGGRISDFVGLPGGGTRALTLDDHGRHSLASSRLRSIARIATLIVHLDIRHYYSPEPDSKLAATSEEMSMPVRLEKEGAVGVIVLDRPPANTYDYEFLKEFGAALDDARFDDGVRAVVVASASEKFFSAGADVAAFAAGSPNQRAMTALLAHEVFRKMENTPMVFVAAIAGHCLGGGFELALACDLRFAARGTYRIGLPEVNLGLFPGSGGTQRLPRLVGLSRGLDLIANATTLKPAEAKDLGIVDRLFPDAAACRAGAIEYAAKLAAGAGVAIGHAKLAITQGYGGPLDLGDRKSTRLNSSH